MKLVLVQVWELVKMMLVLVQVWELVKMKLVLVQVWELVKMKPVLVQVWELVKMMLCGEEGDQLERRSLDSEFGIKMIRVIRYAVCGEY